MINTDITNKNITILGAGISGQGVSQLASFLGANVLLSDIKKPKKINKILINDKIRLEFGFHSNKCLASDLIIISPGIDINKNKFFKKIKSKAIPIVSEIEFGSWFTKSPIVGVTGSNGKSTVVKILNKIFTKKYKNTLLGGNIGQSFSENVLKELKNKLKNVIHILEISSFQLENIYTFNPKVSCLLNITSDHLDRYKNQKEYFNTKLKITKNLNKNSFCIYNKDDQMLDNYFIDKKNIISFSIDKSNKKFLLKNNKIFLLKNNFLIIDQNKTKLIGKHNLSNILASITISKIFNIDNSDITNALMEFQPLEHRLEKVDVKNNITFINDSKGTNLYSTISAVKSFSKRITLILGGYLDNHLDKKLVIKIINKKNIDKIICYGDAGEKIIKIIKDIKYSKYYNNFKEAIINSIKVTRENEIILLSPGFKSFDQFNNFEERGNEFKKIIKNYFK